MKEDNKFGCFFQIVAMFAILGYAVAEVPGIIFGFLLGLFICRTVAVTTNKWEAGSDSGYLRKISNEVLESITKLSYIVMKADESISESELYTFRDYMLQNFGAGAAAAAIEFMKHLQYRKNSVQEATHIINAKLNYPEKMQILQYLFQLAASDGEMHAAEMKLLSQIADEMQILPTDFIYLKNAYNYMYNRRYYQQDYSQNQYSSSVRRSGSLESAYAVLGVKSTDSDAEIKTAYRRLAIANHPDKVQHLGETAHSEAEKRFSQINEAYNRIKKDRKL